MISNYCHICPGVSGKFGQADEIRWATSHANPQKNRVQPGSPQAKKSTPEDTSNATEVAWTWHEEEPVFFGWGKASANRFVFLIFYWEYHTISFRGLLWNKDKQRIYWNRERCGGIPINIINNVWIPISINAVSPSQEGSRPVLLPTALKNNFADGAAWWGSLKGSPNGGFLSHRPPSHPFLFWIFHEINHPATSARVKSYQLLKVVSGGRAPGKSFTTTFSNWTISLFWGRAPGKSFFSFLYCVDV